MSAPFSMSTLRSRDGQHEDMTSSQTGEISRGRSEALVFAMREEANPNNASNFPLLQGKVKIAIGLSQGNVRP